MPQMKQKMMLASQTSDSIWAMQTQAFHSFAASLSDGAEARAFFDDEEDRAPYENIDGVAIIPVEGVILREGFWFFCGLKDIGQALASALDDVGVRAILFSIHSPGGQARGVKELADAILEARKHKPCAAFVDGLCASAAYWLASATGRIYAGPSSEIGSIGVILRHLDKSGWNKDQGLNFTYVTAGAFKAVGNPDSALSESDLGVLQARVNSIYDMFCGDVAANMGLALENRAAWADGRDFLAAEAESLGLITAVVPNRAEALRQLLKEFCMNADELRQKYPDLVALIERDAVQASSQDNAAKIDAAQEKTEKNMLAIMETACGKEAADKVRKLISTGMTPEQLAAAASVFGAQDVSPDREASRRNEMLRAIKDATPGPAACGSGLDPQDEAQAAIQRIGKM